MACITCVLDRAGYREFGAQTKCKCGRKEEAWKQYLYLVCICVSTSEYTHTTDVRILHMFALCCAQLPFHILVSTGSVLLGKYASVLARNIFFLSPFFFNGAAYISLTVSLVVLNSLEVAESIQAVLCRLHTNATLLWITELSIHEFGIQGNLYVYWGICAKLHLITMILYIEYRYQVLKGNSTSSVLPEWSLNRYNEGTQGSHL